MFDYIIYKQLNENTYQLALLYILLSIVCHGILRRWIPLFEMRF
jgi:hypothetical protein